MSESLREQGLRLFARKPLEDRRRINALASISSILPVPDERRQELVVFSQKFARLAEVQPGDKFIQSWRDLRLTQHDLEKDRCPQVAVAVRDIARTGTILFPEINSSVQQTLFNS